MIDADCFSDCGHQQGIDRPLIVKFYFGFGWVNVDVNVRRVEVEVKYIKRVTALIDGTFVGRQHRVVQIIMFYISVVDKKELLAPRFSGKFGFPNITFYGHKRGFFLAINDILTVVFPEPIHDTAANFTRI